MCESRKEVNISKRGIFIYLFLPSCDKKVGVIFGISGISSTGARLNASL
jgi:hypothetical protein